MKRVVLTALLALGLVAGGAVSAHADPTGNTIPTTVHCVPGGNLDVLIKVRGNAASTFDVAAPNGRAYIVLDVTGAVYVGTNAPPAPPDFQFAKVYGNRTGYANQLTCTGQFTITDPKTGQTGINIFTVDVATK